MKKAIQFLTSNKKAIVVIVLIAVAYFLFTKNGKETVAKVTGKLNEQASKQMSLADSWLASTSPEFTKEVFYNGQKYMAQVKHIKGYDNALLPSGEVVVYDNGAMAWMPSSKTDLV